LFHYYFVVSEAFFFLQVNTDWHFIGFYFNEFIFFVFHM